MISSQPISCVAVAKINLGLKIIGQDERGYHLLDSLAVFIGLCDRITLTPADEPSITLTGDFASSLDPSLNGNNIITLALDAFAEATKTTNAYAIQLEKNIPVAAGLGGGASDAAAILLALNSKQRAPLNLAELDEIALKIGADVPLFLRQNEATAWRMQGVGNRLTPVTIPSELGVLLVNNGEAVLTKKVFNHYKTASYSSECKNYDEPITPQNIQDILAYGNDLTEAAISLCPSIAEVLERLDSFNQTPGYLGKGMSGSGGTCFAIFETPLNAIDAAERIKHDSYWHWAGGLFA